MADSMISELFSEVAGVSGSVRFRGGAAAVGSAVEEGRLDYGKGGEGGLVGGV